MQRPSPRPQRRLQRHIGGCPPFGIPAADGLTDHHRSAVAHCDARRFLAAMLQRLEAEVCEACDVEAGRPNAEDTALLMERIILAGARQRRAARG